MTTKKDYDFMVKILPKKKEEIEGAVMGYVNELISALFCPIKGEGKFEVDRVRCELFEVDFNEAVNWGNIRCSEAKEFKDGSFNVTLEEASPDGCSKFKEYIRSYMESYGWTVEVQTEW